MVKYKHITLICGHYGSGKTNIAVNMAIDLKHDYDNVAIADLDIVNPYFRTKDSREILEKNNIRLISSAFAGTNLDAPAVPQEIYSITENRDQKTIVDVGGDDRGALVLGRIAPMILKEGSYDMYLVVNMYRPLSRTPADVIEIKNEIEEACRIPFTGIINNSNLGVETTAEIVERSADYASEVSDLTGLPLILTTVDEDICKRKELKIQNLFPLGIKHFSLLQ